MRESKLAVVIKRLPKVVRSTFDLAAPSALTRFLPSLLYSWFLLEADFRIGDFSKPRPPRGGGQARFEQGLHHESVTNEFERVNLPNSSHQHKTPHHIIETLLF